MFSINFFPTVYRTMFVVPNAMLMNVMACRVFRNTKFDTQWMESTTATAPSLRRRGPAPSHPTTISAIAFQEPNANSSVTLRSLLFRGLTISLAGAKAPPKTKN